MLFLNSCFFYDPTDVANFISGSSAFSKSILNIWKFLVHISLIPHFENCEHYFARMWDECSCEVVGTFIGIAFLWDWSENWPFPVFQNVFFFFFFNFSVYKIFSSFAKFITKNFIVSDVFSNGILSLVLFLGCLLLMFRHTRRFCMLLL